MSRARAAVLAAVEASAGPSTLAELSGTTGLHANTLREHLEALTADGFVRRERSAPAGRGRPAWRYLPVEHCGSPVAEYAGLAAALAAAIHPPIVRRNFLTYDEESLRRSLAHHAEIVAAQRAGNPEWALAVMTSHIANARAVMVRAARLQATDAATRTEETA